MPQIILKNVQFTNVKDKRTGTKTPTTLTLSNVGNSSLGAYVNSANFYKLVSALDIAWGDISVGNGIIISDTADLINWITSLPASGGNGKSAYELYVEEEEGKGNTPLSLSKWLESLLGQQGIAGTSPHIDPETGNWFIGETNTGVQAQGIDGSQGPQGLQGKSNYELYLETVPQGETPLTQLEWLNSLKGLDGTNGVNGDDGKSAYEIYVDHVPNGSTALTEEEWLASLKGKDGKDGPRGFEGKSAYDIYFEKTQDPLDVDEWLASLKGADGTMSFEDLTDEQRESLVGETGPAGPSAYQSYRNTTTDNPIKTEAEWIESLHGQTGADGTTPHIDATTKHWFIGETDTNILAEGVNGQDGKPGVDGSNGITPHIDPTTGNWFIGETDTEVHAQGVPGIDGSNGITPHIDPSTGNWFIGETDTEVHAQGETGQPGADGITPHIDTSTGNWFIGETNTGISAQGPIGQNGADGSTGKSAYELYVDGIQEEPLSQEDWLASLKGDKGDSAYKVAVANGFAGTEQQWLDSLLPTINVDPSSNNASDIYWFIKGEKTQYRAIPQIISITSAAYEALQEKDETAIYVITDSQYNQDNEVTYRIGNITPTTDMNDLDVSVRRSNNVVYFDFTLPIANLDVNNLTEAQATLLRGKSNYQIYVDNHDVDLDGPLLTEEQWLATLKGEVGNDGKSAYELYVKNYISTHGDDTGMLTESEWLNSLIPQIVKDSSDNLYWHINNQKTQYRAFPGIQFLTLDEYNALETKEDDVVYIIDNDKDATALTFNIGNVTTSALETDASVNIRRIDNSIYFDFVLPFSIDSSEYKGESAYEIYKRNASTGEVLSETAWLDSLKGKSAYELFAAANPTSVYTNESQWLASLKGETGKDGSQGPQGPMPTITINQEGNWVVNDQVMPQSALGRLPEIRDGLYIDPETGDELSMKTWWIDGADTNVPTSLGVDVTTLNNKIGAIGNAQEYEPSTYYTAEDQEVIDGTKAAGDLKTSAIPAVPHTVKSYVDNAVANVHVDIDASNIYTKEEVDQKFVNLIGQAPETLDTLKEIADKLNDENTSLGQLNAVLLNKADTSTTYTKSEVNTLYNNINSSLNYYVLKTDLDDTEKVIATTLVQLNESVTNIDASIINIRQNAGSVNPNDLSIYELKEDLINDLSIYELKSDLANDLSIYTSKAYVDQKFSDLINNAPATLDTLKEIADKLSDEDTSLGQLNAILAVKADTSTTYTKSEVDTLYNNINSSLNYYVLKKDLEDTEKVIATALVQLDESITNIDASIIGIKQNGTINSNDLSIYELKSDLVNDLSIYTTKTYVDQKLEDLIGQAPETLDTLKEIADKLSDEDTSLGQLNTVLLNKADTSTTYTKSEVSTLLENYVTVADISANEYVIASALIELNNNKADKDTTYTKAEIDSIIENLDTGVDPNDLSIYELKSDLANDLSIYELKSDLTNDLSIYELKSDLANDLSIYVLNSSLIEIEEVISGAISSLNTNKVDVSALNDYVQKTTLANSEKVIATALVQLNESVTNIDASIINIKQNGTINSNDLSIYELKSDLANDLSIYELKEDLINDLSIYELKSDLANDLSIYELKSDLANDLSNYVLKTYIGTLPNKTENIYYTQEEITNASVGDDAYGKTTADIKTPATQYKDLIEVIEDNEEVTAAAIVDMNNKVTDISTTLSEIYTKTEIDASINDHYYTKSVTDNTFATKESLKLVATSGSYNDLIDKPNIDLNRETADGLYQPKGNYLTEHQSLTDYAKKADISLGYYTKAEVDNAISTNNENYYTKTIADGKYLTSNDISTLADKSELPTIPTTISSFENDSKYLVANDISTKADKSELFSGSYNDLSDKPTIPTTIAQLTDKDDYVTNASLNKRIEDLIGTAPENLDTLGEIATALSDSSDTVAGIVTTLASKADANMVYTKAEADASYQPKGNYLTAHLSLANYYTKADIDASIIEYAQPKGSYYTQSEINIKVTDINTSINSVKTRLDNIDASWVNYYIKSEIDTTVTKIDTSIKNNDSSIATLIQKVDNIFGNTVKIDNGNDSSTIKDYIDDQIYVLTRAVNLLSSTLELALARIDTLEGNA